VAAFSSRAVGENGGVLLGHGKPIFRGAGGAPNMHEPQDKDQAMYAISFLKHAVLSKSEGLQKLLAPCNTDVHRVARTIDVCIVQKESHRQTKMIE
jgi:hypothetical protein